MTWVTHFSFCSDLLAELRKRSSCARSVGAGGEAVYPACTAIKLILDNHSAHISKETKAWLAEQPAHRFDFTFTPNHGSWLNLVEGFLLQTRPLRPAPHPRRVQTGTQGSHHGRKWTTSIGSPLFTPGLTSLKRLPDMIRSSETVT